MSNVKLISHRGNLYGKDELLENNPKHIKNLNIDVEVDVWYIKSNLFLGHDFPKYKITGKPVTKMLDIERAYKIGKKYLVDVHLGNVSY